MSKFRITIEINTDSEDCILPHLLGYIIDAPDARYAERIVRTSLGAIGFDDLAGSIEVEPCDMGMLSSEFNDASLNISQPFGATTDNLPGGIIVVVDRSLHSDQHAAPMPESDIMSDKYDRFVLIGPGVPQVHRSDDDIPCLFYVPGPRNGMISAVPANYQSKLVRFGGNYIRDKEGVFNNGDPVPVFDCLG